MKIRTQLILSAVVFGAVLLAIAASVAVTTAELGRIEERTALADRIGAASSDLDYIANEYLLYGDPGQIEYWSWRYAALSADLANLSAESPEELALARAIADDQQRLRSVFDGIVAGPPASGDQAAFQVAWSRVGVQSQALEYDAARLSTLLEDRAAGLRSLNTTLIVALLGAFGLFLLGGFAVVGRRTLRSLDALQAGADAIGSGDLGYALELPGDDEVGDLARTFNRMAGDLATVTASRAELEAAQAELRSVALFPLQNPYPVLRADEEGRLLFSNPAGAALLGGLEVGRPLPEPLCRAAREACAGGTRRTIEQDFGTTTYAIAVAPLPEHGYANLYFVDITERQRAEAALRERERTLQSVFRAAPVGIGICSDRTLRSVNASLCAMTGYTEDELLGQPTRLLYPDDEEYDRVGREKYGQIIGAGIGVVETRWRRKDGGEIEVLLSASPMDRSSPYENVVTIALDLTPLAEKEAALRASEARYRELVEQAGSIILRYDRDGRLTFVNEFAQRFFGFSAGELLGRTAIGTIIPETESSTGRDLAGMVREIVRSPSTYAENENENITKDGRRVWVRWANRPIVGPDGEVREFLAIGTDITGRRAVEAALAESEAKYRHLFMHDITGDFIAAADGRILDCNPAFALMFGFASVEEALSSNIVETYITPEDRPALLDRVRHEGMVQYDARFRRRVDGTEIHVVENILGRFDDDGALVETQGYIIEDTERYRAEEELRQSREWFRVMGEALPYGVWRCNPRGGAEYTSQSFLDLLEMTEDEMREFGWTHRLPPDEVAPMLERWMHCVETGEDWDDEHHVLGPDGVYHTVLTRGRPVRDRDGAIVAWVGINLDIDERKRAEEALREYAEDLRRSNEDLERFAYVSSHDLQEPLRSIVSFSQLLERRYRGHLDSNADEYIDFIVEGGNRMQQLIQDLLAYSRVNTTRQALTPTATDDVLAAVERNLALQLTEAGGVITSDPLPMVLADPIQLEQVLMNLVSNAIKFRKPDVPLRIHVGARRLDGFWEFSVADNGIGIEKEYFDRIFVLFQRLHTKDAYPGTGIGLAIVKRIIDRHGGKIWLESRPGEGSTFFFTLPAA